MDYHLSKILADLFEWEDDSPHHAVTHVENAVRNLQAELGVAKAFHDVAVKERDLARLQLMKVCSAAQDLLEFMNALPDEYGGIPHADALEEVLLSISGGKSENW